ncbi:MAG: CDGSH iron-sulfur domain-containing protein [Dehalococcoidia bacterium]
MAAHIRITATGPYIVTGGVPLNGRRPAESVHGEPLAWEPVLERPDGYEVEERYALCRCGGSANKPFCDGTHASNGFDGALTASREPGASRRETLAGDGMSVTDDTTLCADAGFCGTRFANVWDLAENTGDPEVKAQVIRMAQNCPSGRLVAHDARGAAIEPEYRPSIAPVPDGPLWVRGGITMETADGVALETRNRMTLCRCGQSQNKPFCDGAHKSHEFKAP